MLFRQDTVVPVDQPAQQPCRWVISAPTSTFADVPISAPAATSILSLRRSRLTDHPDCFSDGVKPAINE
jgi:hypothetical protein